MGGKYEGVPVTKAAADSAVRASSQSTCGQFSFRYSNSLSGLATCISAFPGCRTQPTSRTRLARWGKRPSDSPLSPLMIAKLHVGATSAVSVMLSALKGKPVDTCGSSRRAQSASQASSRSRTRERAPSAPITNLVWKLVVWDPSCRVSWTVTASGAPTPPAGSCSNPMHFAPKCTVTALGYSSWSCPYRNCNKSFLQSQYVSWCTSFIMDATPFVLPSGVKTVSTSGLRHATSLNFSSSPAARIHFMPCPSIR
mmetsp:Transcript_93462/g.161910  ORF Transcript_93462/g.161910 Transcript_93462/m.161910 type:complete len:254 (+) Transcript_93462:729-1490(+)